MTYVGGKDKYAKDIIPIILKDRKPGQWYVELMCGGCNVIDKVDGNRIANDIHPYLIKLLKYIEAGGDLNSYTVISEELYKMVRTNPNVFTEWFVGLVGFGCTFSAKWFGGYARGKKQDGIPRNYLAERIRNISKQAPLLNGVNFYNLPYWEVPIPNNSIVYLDPPYAGTTSYAGTNSFDHAAFWEFARNLWFKGHEVFISEYTAPSDFECIWEKPVYSNLNTGGLSMKQKNYLHTQYN